MTLLKLPVGQVGKVIGIKGVGCSTEPYFARYCSRPPSEAHSNATNGWSGHDPGDWWGKNRSRSWYGFTRHREGILR